MDMKKIFAYGVATALLIGTSGGLGTVIKHKNEVKALEEKERKNMPGITLESKVHDIAENKLRYKNFTSSVAPLFGKLDETDLKIIILVNDKNVSVDQTINDTKTLSKLTNVPEKEIMILKGEGK